MFSTVYEIAYSLLSFFPCFSCVLASQFFFLFFFLLLSFMYNIKKQKLHFKDIAVVLLHLAQSFDFYIHNKKINWKIFCKCKQLLQSNPPTVLYLKQFEKKDLEWNFMNKKVFLHHCPFYPSQNRYNIIIVSKYCIFYTYNF